MPLNPGLRRVARGRVPLLPGVHAMSFRARLTLFFFLIVIVPLISVAVIVFRLIGDNEHGQADSRLAQGQTAAFGLYRQQVDEAGAAAARVGADPRLARLLRAGDRQALASEV